jgi:predicted Zn-dependent protease
VRLVLLLSVCLASGLNAQTDPQVVYERGKQYFELSAQAFRQIEKAAPGSAYAMALLGEEMARKRQYSTALDAYNQALTRMPGFRGLQAEVADVYAAEGKPAEASEARAGEEKLGSPDCTTETLQCDFSAGRFNEVIKAAKGKNAPERLYWLARAYYGLALEAFGELDKLPESAGLHRAKAQLLRDERKYGESVEEWRAALRLSPDDRSLRRELAATLYFSQNYRAILPELEQLLKADPDSANLNFFVGDSLLETEQNEKAVPYLETALRLDPKLVPAHVALGMCYVRLDDAEKAIPHLKAGAALDKSGRLYYLLARAYKKTGQPELAKSMMDRYQQLQKASAAK